MISDEENSISSDDSESEYSDCGEQYCTFDQIVTETYRSELKSLSQEIVNLLERKSELTSRL